MWKPWLLTSIFILRDVILLSLFFFFNCCSLHPDDNSGTEEPTNEKDKGGKESQGEDEDIGLDKNDRDEDKSDGDDKEEDKDKGRYITGPQKSVSVFSSRAMVANGAVKWPNNAVLDLPAVLNSLSYSQLSA